MWEDSRLTIDICWDDGLTCFTVSLRLYDNALVGCCVELETAPGLS